MKKALALISVMMALILLSCVSLQEKQASGAGVMTLQRAKGSVEIYRFGDFVLHANKTDDALSDVDVKISYVMRASEYATSCKNAEEFTAAMEAVFPEYLGKNYLEITAAALFNITN